MSFYYDLKEMIERHERRKNKPYVDTVGKITIGIGHNLTDRGVSDAIIDLMYNEDIEEARASLYYVFPNFDTFSDRRRMALYDLMFNLGLTRFQGFKNMIQAIEWDNWLTASQELLNSKYATQVGHRAVELVQMMEEG